MTASPFHIAGFLPPAFHCPPLCEVNDLGGGALLPRFAARFFPRVHARQKPTRGLVKSFRVCLHFIRSFHAVKFGRERIGSVQKVFGEIQNVCG